MAATDAVFRYEQIAAELRDRIAGGVHAVGEKLPPETVLARQMGVNRLTLRKALAILEGDGAIVRQRGRGTFVAGGMAGASAAAVLFIGDYESDFYRELYVQLSAEGQRVGLTVAGFNPERSSETGGLGAMTARAARARCVVCAGNWWVALAERLPAEHAPLVALHYAEAGLAPPQAGPPAYHISIDPLRAAYLATQHLIERGHRRIAFVGVHPRKDCSAPFPEPVMENMNYAGYRLALQTHAIEEHQAYAYYGGVEEGDRRVAAFLDHLGDWPTAFVFGSDFRAASLFHAAADRGIAIPDDLSVVGIGNTPWSEAVRPQLTTLAVGEAEMARLAVSLCRAPRPEAPAVAYVAPRLVERGSVKRKEGEC